jgi:hypothetical protein
LPKGNGLTGPEATALWNRLGDEDASRAYAAVWRFCQRPEEAVEFLKACFRIGSPPSPSELQDLIRSLDSNLFAEREAASLRLERLGRVAEKSLRGGLNAGPTVGTKETD